jgi:hypothetical protein
MSTDKMRESYELTYAISWQGEDEDCKAWELAWNASRAALVIELPPVRPEPTSSGDELKADGEAAAWNIWVGEKLAKADCREAIEAQGLKVKP